MHRLAWKMGEKVSITDTKGKKEDISTFFSIFFDLRQIRTAEFKTEKSPEQTDLIVTWTGVHCPTTTQADQKHS